MRPDARQVEYSMPSPCKLQDKIVGNKCFSKRRMLEVLEVSKTGTFEALGGVSRRIPETNSESIMPVRGVSLSDIFWI